MTNSFLLEIGVEELPARFVLDTIKQFKEEAESWLQAHNIEYESIETFSTPRRIAILVENINEKQKTITEKVRGPHIGIAKDTEGNWTKAAIGFTKGQGKSVEDIYIESVKEKEYIFVEKTTVGKDADIILQSISEIIDKLHFPQTMNWGSKSYRFARPIRWLTAIWNDEVVPMEIAGIPSSNVTYGHRFLGKKVTIKSATSYEQLLNEQFVIPKYTQRRNIILEQIRDYENDAQVKVVIEDDLLEEVTNLVEYPTLFVGEFSERYLSLPKEVLITSMKEHQRYFPVFEQSGNQLLSRFVGIRNGNTAYIKNVVKGNEKVLRARLQDGEFFFEEDQKKSISFFNDKLKNVVFQKEIGTVYEKVQNTVKLTKIISEHLNISSEVKSNALRASEICKFDLMTNMVNEFTELQGIMGEKYAKIFGENDAVARAIREHYLPTSAQGKVPSTTEGAIVAISDKLVTVMSCFNVGMQPTGSQDPLGLRRQSNGILNILKAFEWDISVETLINLSNQVFEIKEEKVINDLKQFIQERMIYLFGLASYEHDIIQAVLAHKLGVISVEEAKIKLLTELKYSDHFRTTQESLVRVINISKKHESSQEIREELFETASEKELYQIVQSVENNIENDLKENKFEAALEELKKLSLPIETFFNENMVMADDKAVKSNRIALMHQISDLTKHFGDLTMVEWKQRH